MARLLIAALALAISICGGTYVANSQTNPGFNPNLQWCGIQGSVAIRGATKWQCLLPGTNGQALLSGGPAANPSWVTLTGTGTVTSVSGSGGTTGLTLTGGPITGAGTLTLGGTLAIANGGTGGTGAANTVFKSNGTVNSFGQIVNGDITAGTITNTAINAAAAIAPSKLAAQGALTVLANITGGSAVPTTPTVTALLDAAFTTTQGSVLYRNVSGWSSLAPGSNGQFLSTAGAGANPSWQTVTGGNIGSIPNGTVLANISGSSGAPANPTVTQLLDATLGATQGQIAYRNATVWTVLSPGTSGALLSTGGAAANPAWSTLGQIKGEPSNTTASAGNIGQVIKSVIPSGSAVAMGNGSTTVITSISLTAGDWDISALGYVSPFGSSLISYLGCAISTTAADIAGFASATDAIAGRTSNGGAATYSITPTDLQLSATTTVYLNCLSSTAAANAIGWGTLRARRMR